MLTQLLRRRTRRKLIWLLLGSMGMSSLSGCSRQFWRLQADRDTYNAIAERLNDPRWQLPRTELTPDPRSRFFDPYDPDKEPLPPDDPAAHTYMHCVNGKKGYKNWHKLGTSFALENPQWLEPYGIHTGNVDPVNGHAQLKLAGLTLPQVMDLATIHSREYQTAIEDLYISSLNLTAERFALGVRYLFNSREPGASFNANTDRDGNGRGLFTQSFGISQLLPTGGQIAVEIANSVTWVFTGNGSQVSAPTLGYSFTQPLLFNAGRKIVLEALTQAERDVLYQARTLARFRQTLFTQVTVNFLNLLQIRQGILNAENNIRQLEEQLEAQLVKDSYVPEGVTAALEGIQNLEIPDAVSEKLSWDGNWLKWRGSMTDEEQELLMTMSQDRRYLTAAQELIDAKQQQTTTLSYLQLRDRLNQGQSTLANNQRQLADQQDALKIILGLPPNAELNIDETLLGPFELISWDLINLERSSRDIQQRVGERLLPDRENNQEEDKPPGLDIVRIYIGELTRIRDELYQVGILQVQRDFEPLQEILEMTQDDWSVMRPGLRYFRSEEERNRLVERITNDLRLYRLAEREFTFGSEMLDMLSNLTNYDSEQAMLQALDRNGSGVLELSELPTEWRELPRTGQKEAKESYTIPELLAESASGMRDLRDKYLLRMAQSLEVLQASLRVEQIAVVPFSLDGTMNVPDVEEVVRIGLENRHDLMNARASVMDARRAVEIAANTLEAGLDVTFSGRQGLNPNGRNGGGVGHSATLQFTTPLDQIDERNLYRQTLLEYQRERRRYMEAEDRVKLAIRQSWRQIQVQEYRLEIDRTTVRNAALQYDSASLQAAGGQQTNALSLVNALDAVLQAQNSLVQDWISYETNRLNIYRDMGIMEIDPRGVWTDPFYLQMSSQPAEDAVSPPAETPDAVLPAPQSMN